MRRNLRRPWTVLLALILITAAGCAASRPADVPPDERFGHRPEEDGHRVTVTVTPPDSSTSYFYYPALFDTVHIRPAPFDPARPVDAQQVPVELLIKGALPDACTELHDARQARYGHIIEIELETRRPQGAVCANVVRPYRFYVMLDGTYGVGSYTLKINGRVYPFVVEAPDAG